MSQIAWLGPHDPFPNPLFESDPDSFTHPSSSLICRVSRFVSVQ